MKKGVFALISFSFSGGKIALYLYVCAVVIRLGMKI